MRIRLKDVPKIMARGDLEDKNLFLNLLEMRWMQLNQDEQITLLEVLRHLTDSLLQNPLVTSGH